MTCHAYGHVKVNFSRALLKGERLPSRQFFWTCRAQCLRWDEAVGGVCRHSPASHWQYVVGPSSFWWSFTLPAVTLLVELPWSVRKWTVRTTTLQHLCGWCCCCKQIWSYLETSAWRCNPMAYRWPCSFGHTSFYSSWLSCSIWGCYTPDTTISEICFWDSRWQRNEYLTA